jgi:hypothetical protein
MRIWHTSLIPILCQKHLCAMWREGLGAYKIITENKQGYRNHPATQEYINAPRALYYVLALTRHEMLKRAYHPKELPAMPQLTGDKETLNQWQTLAEQITILKAKGCKCKLHNF